MLTEFDEATHRLSGCAIEVRRHMGPGPLESAYAPCLSEELNRNGIFVLLE